MPLHEAFAEKYEILDRIGQGGMGAVYRVRHRLLDELRVIKVIRSPLEPTPELLERFRREARTASRLRHPNLAVLHDFDIDEDGRAYLVLEHIDGLTLREVLHRFGTPPLPLTLEIGVQACRALDYLHRQRIVHRDVSPRNLMLCRDLAAQPAERPLLRLIDLGLAKSLEGEGDGLTTGGVFLGSLRYASPEQFGVEPLDERSDLYSLGMVLYELLTGVSPIHGIDPGSWMAAHLFGTPLDFAASDPEGSVPADLRALVMSALARRPEERIASAEAFGEALGALQERYPLEGDELEPLFAPEPAVEESPVEVAPEAVLAPVVAESHEAHETQIPLAELPVLAPAAAAAAGPRLDDVTWGGGAPQVASSAPLWEPGQPVPIVAPPPARRTPLLPAASLVAVILVLGVFVLLNALPTWQPRLGRPPVATEARATPVVRLASSSAPPVMPATPAPPATPAIPEPRAAAPAAEPPAPVHPPVETLAGGDQDEPDPAVLAEAAGATETAGTPSPAEATRAPRPVQRPVPSVRHRRPEAAAPRLAAIEKPERLAQRAAPPRAWAATPASRPAPLGRMRRGDLIQPGPGVAVPVPLDMPRFSYPAAARGRAGEVAVRLALLVDENGRVVDAVVREGDDTGLGFNETALAAARHVPFQPATRNDVPGKMWTEMIFEFADSAAAGRRGRSGQ